MLVCLVLAGLYGAVSGITGRLEENKSNAQALSQGIILFALIVCFFIYGFFSGYSMWHTYRPTREFTMQIRFELFFYYEMIGFGIANFCVMASAYLIIQICRQLLAFVLLRARQTAVFFGRIFRRR